MQYLFQLGREVDLSAAEADIVLAQSKISVLRRATKNGIFRIETDTSIDCSALMKRLGGTIKIMRAIPLTLSAENIATYLNEVVLEGKIAFSITGGDRHLPIQVKKLLKQMDRSARFVEIKNSASILFNGLIVDHTDLTIMDNEFFVTEAIQPFEEFSRRDFGRPAADSFSGMLPPKLARIMINLSGTDAESTLLDPHCGSGTILTEAAELGFRHIIGTDVSPKAVKDTDTNLNWLESELKISTNKKVFVCDVRQIHNSLEKNSVDAIVTEPYLGTPLDGNERPDTIEKEVKNLSVLYSEGLNSLSQILKSTGTIIMIIPKFKITTTSWAEIDIKKILPPSLTISPWTPTQDHLSYFRPDQKLARLIYRFKKTG